MQSNYRKLLSTPEWYEFRKTVFERDNYTCQICNKKKSAHELHVHHMLYIEGKEIWDYPQELIKTLCVDCHDNWHKKHGFMIYRLPKPGYRLETCSRCRGEGLLNMRNGKICKCKLCDGTGSVYVEDIDPIEE